MMNQSPRLADETLVSTFNIFLDSSEVTNPGATGEGDQGLDCTFSFGASSVVAKQGENIRLSLIQYDSYSNSPTVNDANNDMTVTINNINSITKTDEPVYLTYGYYGSPRSVGYDALRSIADFLEKINFYATTTGVFSINVDLTKPGVSRVGSQGTPEDTNTFTFAGTSQRMIEGNLIWLNSTHGITQANVTNGDIVFATGDQTSDLLGTGGEWTLTYVNTTELKLTGKFPAQRSTEAFHYVRCNLANNNLASACAQEKTQNSKNIVSSDILGKVPVQAEITSFFSPDPVYSITLHDKVLSKLNIRVTDSRNRTLRRQTLGQYLNSGNLSFRCVLRCDIVKGTNSTTTPVALGVQQNQNNMGPDSFADGVAGFAQIRSFP